MSRRDQLEQMLESNPDDVFLNYALAMEFVSEGKTVAGLERFQRVIEIDPDYVAAYFQSGQILAKDGEDEAAKESVTRGIEVARRNGDDHAETEMTAFLDML